MSPVPICNQTPRTDLPYALIGEAPCAAPVVADGVAIGPGDLAGQAMLLVVLIRLLDDAAEAIYRDREAAEACIARASALLQAHQNRDIPGEEQAPPVLVSGGLAPWKIIRVRTYVEAHLDSTIRVRDLASITHVSIGYFSRSFTRCVGVPPVAYIAARRLARAQHLMLTTEERLSQIALTCGFYDQSNLARMFRRHFGTSPSAWRRRHKGELGVLRPALPMSASNRACEPGPTRSLVRRAI